MNFFQVFFSKKSSFCREKLKIIGAFTILLEFY